MSDARLARGWIALQTAVGAIAALISLSAAVYSIGTAESQSIERLREWNRSHRIEQIKLEHRVKDLEQSQPPFVPPRFPGRIGSITTP